MKGLYIKILVSVGLCIGLASCGEDANQKSATQQDQNSTVATPSNENTPPPQIVTGNGVRNFVVLDGTVRQGSRFVFPEVEIEKNGWLVVHPFRDGTPVQTEYTGHTYLAAGNHRDVDIEVDPAPLSGEMIIVMLHYDVNNDQVFDFNDGITVPDAPVFEDGTLVALRYTAP